MPSGADKGLGESGGQERPDLRFFPPSPAPPATMAPAGPTSPMSAGTGLSWERVFALRGVPVPLTRVTLLFNFLLEAHLESLVNYWLEDSLTRPQYL